MTIQPKRTNSFMKALLISGLLAIAGCGKDVCLDRQEQLCKHCDLEGYQRDVTCACIEKGKVRNQDQYFTSSKAAEVACYDIQNSLDNSYAGPDREAECAGELKTLEEYKSDACELFGYESAGGGGTTSLGGSCQELADCYGVSVEELGGMSNADCEEYLQMYDC
jgi:hypothetical protein